MIPRPFPLCLAFLLAGASMAWSAEGRKPPSAATAEVIVYGATPGGIAATIAAARQGRKVFLVEPSGKVGGLLTSGLSNTDFRSFPSLTGIFLEFTQRVDEDYRVRYGPGSANRIACFRGTHGEPHLNEQILEAMLIRQPTVEIFLRRRLKDVHTRRGKKGKTIESIVLVSADGKERQTLAGEMFIDCSYEGDLMAMAGVPYHVGRESRARYGESLAGNEKGEGDGQVQGYNFRLIMTRVPENRVMPGPPKGYRREDFLPVLEHFKSGRLKKVFASGHDGIYRAHEPLLPNRKADVNDTPHAPVRLSMPDINDAYPDGDLATRQRIFDQHVYYNLGLLYFLQNDKAVPAAIREPAREWGFCKDEMQRTDHFPPLLYIREARRMIGMHVYTQHDTEDAPGDSRSRLHTDSITIGDYVHNCHGTGRVGTRLEGKNVGEFYKNIRPYQVPYGVIVPKDVTNLLVPVAVSASHVGFSALRLEPIWTSLGQAAGHAAHLAIEKKVPVQEIPVATLQGRLHSDRLATIYVSDVPPSSPHFQAVQWLGTRGGLHGEYDPEKEPLAKPKPLVGQYCEPFPGHAARLDHSITQNTLALWIQLLPEKKQPQAREALHADGKLTRKDALQKMYQLANPAR